MVATLAAKPISSASRWPVCPKLRTATLSRKEFQLFEIPMQNIKKVKAAMNRMQGMYILADKPRVAFDKEEFNEHLMTHWANRLGLIPLDVTQHDFLMFVQQTSSLRALIQDVQFSLCLPQLFQAIENEARFYAELRSAISIRNRAMIAQAIDALQKKGCDVFSVYFEHERLRYQMNRNGELEISGKGFNVQQALDVKSVLYLSGIPNM